MYQQKITNYIEVDAIFRSALYIKSFIKRYADFEWKSFQLLEIASWFLVDFST